MDLIMEDMDNEVRKVHGTAGTPALECLDERVPVYALRWGFSGNTGDQGSSAFGVSYYETMFSHEPTAGEMATAISGWLESVTEPEPVGVDGHPVWYDPGERNSLESYLQDTEGTVRLHALDGATLTVDAAVALTVIREMNRYAVGIETWLRGKGEELLSKATAEEMNGVDLASGKPGAVSLSTATIAGELEEERANDPGILASKLATLTVNRVSLTAAEALELKPLFPVWGEKGAEFGVDRPVGFRFRYGESLYEVVVASALQEDWVPTEVPNLYKVVQVEHGGTIDDPIPWERKMELVNGRYYTDQGVLYECIRDSGMPMDFDLKDLVSGGFVKVVEDE